MYDEVTASRNENVKKKKVLYFLFAASTKSKELKLKKKKRERGAELWKSTKRDYYFNRMRATALNSDPATKLLKKRVPPKKKLS